MDTIGSEIKIDSLQTEVNFSIKGESEVVLHIVDDMNTNVKYKLVIGGQENTVTYLSEITKGEEDYYKRKYLLLVGFSLKTEIVVPLKFYVVRQ